MKINNLLISAGFIAAAGMTADAVTPNAAQLKNADSDVILHAWSWSFDNIARNMKKIADAGYDYVQTSPAQACYVGEGGGLALFSDENSAEKGKWYYYYQPTDWTIGNYILGDRDAFRNMCDSAYKYNVKVIVDVLPNHTAIDHKAVLPGLDNAVGGHKNLFHANGFSPIRDYNDRLQCTTGEMGGLPDVNTENPDFQKYYLQYVNDLINLGARGFRYDTAKHIGLPSDPLDPKVEEAGLSNDFWDVATGRKPVHGLWMMMPDSVYIYGEVLQDKNVKETEYAEYMDQTASGYGHVLRHVLETGDTRVEDLTNWQHPVDPLHLVTWVESHDTYCNAHESAGLTDDQIRTGWVFLAARNGGRPLFYSRPAGSTRQNYWGNNKASEAGNDEFRHPEVVAVNHFRAAMSGKPEKLFFTDNGAVAEVARGDAGAALVNFSAKEQKIKLDTTLPDGEYADAVSGTRFSVKKSKVEGKLAPLTTYILYSI